jgi:hypothetical protein
MMTKYRHRAVQPGTAMTAHGDGPGATPVPDLVSAKNP